MGTDREGAQVSEGGEWAGKPVLPGSGGQGTRSLSLSGGATGHADAPEPSKPVLTRGPQAGLNVIKESEAQLWWAAKELRRTKKLSDYVGKNEKTKIIVKIQQVSALTLMCHCWFFLTYFHTDKNLQYI